MADKSRFGPELSEAEIDALVEELLILEFVIKQLLVYTDSVILVCQAI